MAFPIAHRYIDESFLFEPEKNIYTEDMRIGKPYDYKKSQWNLKQRAMFIEAVTKQFIKNQFN